MSGKLRHLALIMDGNGRWAEARGLDRSKGHEEGGRATEKVVKGCLNEGIEFLTLYCFSTENWKRPKKEVDYLMGLFAKKTVEEIPNFNKYGVRILHTGCREGLPEKDLIALDKAINETADNKQLTVILAINYGGKDEIRRAINKAISDGMTVFENDTLEHYLDNPEVPFPDMICRSAGEIRLSGFMLYQSAYAELGFYDKLWPDWDETMIHTIVSDYSHRCRKYGGIKDNELTC